MLLSTLWFNSMNGFNYMFSLGDVCSSKLNVVQTTPFFFQSVQQLTSWMYTEYVSTIAKALVESAYMCGLLNCLYEYPEKVTGIVCYNESNC